MSASSTASAHTPKHGVSRRDFLGMALGTLISLPAVAGGYLVPASVAHAAESPKGAEQDGGEALEGTTKITMVSASEVGFVVVDTSNGGRIKVPGATVKVTTSTTPRPTRPSTWTTTPSASSWSRAVPTTPGPSTSSCARPKSSATTSGPRAASLPSRPRRA